MAKSKVSNGEFERGRRHLSRRDLVLRRLIRQIGPCTLGHDPDGFGVLVRAIISQQISTKAAQAIGQRLLSGLGKGGLCPAGILRASDAQLRAAGLSASKVLSLRDLAGRCRNRELDLAELPSLPDDEVVARLVPVRGIGRWTAEMFLIFSLGRLDVLPVADYGLRSGVQRHYELDDLPAPQELFRRAEPWRPYRSIATWFIWRSLGNVPQST